MKFQINWNYSLCIENSCILNLSDFQGLNTYEGGCPYCECSYNDTIRPLIM